MSRRGGGLQRRGSTVLRIYVIIFVGMYIAVTMAYALEFLVAHPDAGWGVDRAIEYSLRWPLRLI